MSISEHDLETLEVWLDGDLGIEQAEALRRRLSAEPELAQTLDRLRSDRQLRAHVWQSLDPTDTEVESLVSNVRRAVQKEELWTVRFRALRSVSGIAASIVLVFMVGWIAHERVRFGPVTQNNTVAANSQAQPRQTQVATNAQQPANANILPTVTPASFAPTVRPPSANKYTVTVAAPNGLIYVKQVDGLQGVQDFPDQYIRDLMQVQLQQGGTFSIGNLPQVASPGQGSSTIQPANALIQDPQRNP